MHTCHSSESAVPFLTHVPLIGLISLFIPASAATCEGCYLPLTKEQLTTAKGDFILQYKVAVPN